MLLQKSTDNIELEESPRYEKNKQKRRAVGFTLSGLVSAPLVNDMPN